MTLAPASLRVTEEGEDRGVAVVYITLRRRPGPAAPAGADELPGGGGPGGVGPTVVALGFTSLFTDVSAEMVTAILPLYLTFQLRLTSVQFGLVDGLTQAVAAITLLAGAVVADRTRRYKEVAGVGYAASAGCKLGLLAAGSAWLPTTALLLVDRTAKGLRTAPRDSLISLSAPPGRLNTAFGVHRALDTTGAVLGPFAAFLLLSLAPGGYGSVFVVSFLVAVIGLGVLTCFVDGTPFAAAPPAPRPSVRSGISGLVRVPGFGRILAAAAVLNTLTVSDAFVYLTLQQRSSFQSRFFPLLFVGTAVAYLVLAVPAGRLADRVGSRAVFAGGYVILACAYVALLAADPGPWSVLAALVLLGSYYAATDGVLMALASRVVPRPRRATGLALVATVVAAARFASSLGFGVLWARLGPGAAVVVYLAGLCAALPGVVWLLGRTPEVSSP